jgi:hypothetical protein
LTLHPAEKFHGFKDIERLAVASLPAAGDVARLIRPHD